MSEPTTERRGTRWRCMHESWDKYGRLRVNVRRCHNFTNHPSGLCWVHRPKVGIEQ